MPDPIYRHPQESTHTPSPGLRERLELVPPARIIAAVEDSGSVLTINDLRQYAKHLAAEFEHHAASAAAMAPVWYADHIKHCTLEQGRTIRLLTIELCEEVTLYTGYQQARMAGGIRRAHALDAFGTVMVGFLLALLVGLYFAHDDGDDGYGPPPNVATQAVAR